MRVFVLLLWLLIPLGAALYHIGPGQEQLQIDVVANQTRLAEQAVAEEEWTIAEKHYAAAIEALPQERVAEHRRLSLEQAKVWMNNKKLSTAHAALKTLVDEVADDQEADPKLLADSQEALANSQYYMTYLMRLEGHPRGRWEPEVESARQTYRLLAEQAKKVGDSAAETKHKEDLESTILLARMDLGELQGLPLPSQ